MRNLASGDDPAKTQTLGLTEGTSGWNGGSSTKSLHDHHHKSHIPGAKEGPGNWTKSPADGNEERQDRLRQGALGCVFATNGVNWQSLNEVQRLQASVLVP